LRFCSYCGFKLGVVKAALAEGEEAPAATSSETPTLTRQPRQRDMNLGVILMFAGAVFASLMAGSTGLGLGRGAGATLLATLYLAILVLSRPITKGIQKLLSWEQSSENLATSQRGMCFGTTLMFISTVMLAIGSFLMFGRMRTQPFFIGLVLAFALLLLICRHLMRGLQYLTQDESKASLSQLPEAADQTAHLASLFDVPSLAAGQSATVPIFGQKVTTAEIVAPSSITEHTTNLLERNSEQS
jgi:hypothetical protein